jgi:hypothetical protein
MDSQATCRFLDFWIVTPGDLDAIALILAGAWAG